MQPAVQHTAQPITPPILYSFRRCPYAIRARLAIQVSGTVVQLREVALRDKPAALIAASAKATVPVLQLPDGTVLDQSLDIMRWALSIHDPEGWLRDDEADDVQAWVDRNDGPFKALLDGYKYAARHPGRSAQDCRDEAVALMLQPLNARLAAQRFLLRASCSLADMALLPFVRQFAACDTAWFASAPLTHVQRWLAQLTATPLFTAVMDKHRPWRPGDAAGQASLT